MYQIVWRFDARPGRVEEFEREYGPAGSWAVLFAASPEFVRTELFRDVSGAGRFVTIDLWRSREAFERFKREHAAEYQALDRRCEELTVTEERISAGNVAEAFSCTIRRAGVTDAAALSELMRRTFVETFAAQNDPADMEQYVALSYNLRQQEHELRDPDYLTLLVEEQGVAIAFAQLRRHASPSVPSEANAVEIFRFYVDQRWHGKGVARELMREVSAAAQELGGRSAWLGVWEHNPRAIAFYRRCGFEVVGAQKFTIGSDVQTDYVMLSPLPIRV